MDINKANKLTEAVYAVLRVELGAAAHEFGELTIKQAGGGRYDANSLTLKIEFREKAKHDSGVEMTREAEDFIRDAHFYGLKAEDLGRVVDSPRLGKIQIVGLKTRARKFPIIAKQVATGKMYKIGEDSVAVLCGRRPEPNGTTTVIDEPIGGA